MLLTDDNDVNTACSCSQMAQANTPLLPHLWGVVRVLAAAPAVPVREVEREVAAGEAVVHVVVPHGVQGARQVPPPVQAPQRQHEQRLQRGDEGRDFVAGVPACTGAALSTMGAPHNMPTSFACSSHAGQEAHHGKADRSAIIADDWRGQ